MQKRPTKSQIKDLLPALCGGMVVLIGGVVLSGWVLKVGPLTSVSNTFITMKVNTALCFVMMGISLMLLNSAQRSRNQLLAAMGLCTLTFWISVLTLIQYIYKINLGIDEFFIADPTSAGRFPPGRLAPITAINFMILAASFVIQNVFRKPYYRTAQLFVIMVFMASFQSLVGYLIGVTYLFGTAFYTQMALLTSVNFVLLTVGIFSSRAEFGFGEMFMANTANARMARRMMAGVVLVPPLVRWVSIHGLEAHFYDEDFALLIQLTGTMMLMALILVTSFQALIRSEESRVAETRLSKRFELIADSLPALIGYVSENERYLFANQTYEKWFGVPTQNVLGKTMSEIIGEQNRGQVHSQIAHAMETQTTTTFDGEMLLVSGKSIFYHADYVPDLDAHGKIQGCIILGTDVTERAQARKDLQASEERLKLAIRGAQMGTWSMSLPGYEIVSDERFRELHNAVDVPDVRANIDMLVHPADRARIASALDHSIRTGAAYDCEYRIVNADGSARWIYARGEPKYDDANQKPVSISGVSFDISERKRIEIKLAEALRFAERANEAKSAFLANMSHEIRTPLGAILGFTELIKDSESAEERSEYAGIIERSGKSLTKIIDDILDLSKVEAGRLELEKINFDVEKTVREVAELFVDAAQKKNLTLELAFDPQTPVKIKSDPTRIRQILINLIGNAVKFTSTGKVHIAVTGAYFENQLTHLRFAITDTGVGLTEEQEHKLFAPFSQADNSTTRKFGGSGLGLALSKRLANALGGDVWVASSKTGEGSTFMATVQADSSSDIAVAAPATKALEKSKTLQGLRVLLVEDSLDNQMLIQKVITRRGGSVEVANNGLEGVLKAQAGDGFDVILMDMQMPILDGYAATEQLRERGYKKPIIALTAHAMAEERKRTEEIGCNAHLTKPLDFELLITTLDRFGRETKDI